MVAEARNGKDSTEVSFNATVAYASGEIIQLADGRAGVANNMQGYAINDKAVFLVSGQRTVTKASPVTWLRGSNIYWSRSNSNATPLKPADGFLLGVAEDDVAATATEGKVLLNVRQVNAIEWPSDAFIEGSVAGGGATHFGGLATVIVGTGAEIAMGALYSEETVDIDDGPIFTARIRISNSGDHAALDINWGLVDATHASDMDAVVVSCLFHFDGHDTELDIDVESDDGTTEVGTIDTTINFVKATYHEYWIDCRNKADIQMYVDGVLILPGTVFNLSAYSGGVRPIVHLEKSSNDTPGIVLIKELSVRTSD